MTTYIKLEDALKMMKSHKEKLCGIDNGVIQMILIDLLYIQTISPESMIEEMIEEQDSYTINQDTFDSQNNKKEVLKELLQKFKS